MEEAISDKMMQPGWWSSYCIIPNEPPQQNFTAPRSGVSDLVTPRDALPPKLPKLTQFIKLIEPRARRASPQGHGKSLPDAVKTIDFASLLEGFWPNP